MKLKIKLISCLILFGLFTSGQTNSIKVEVPLWALPGSKDHKQVPPPADFHRTTKTNTKRIGMFKGQSDVGAALVSGSSSYDKTTKEYTINSAGYNIWYTRDEFRYLWKKMSGDVSIAADVMFPIAEGFNDRKAVLIIRQSLKDDSKDIMAGLHGRGLIHLAWRQEDGELTKGMPVEPHGALRIGLEKRGDVFTLFVSQSGEPMKQYGESIQLHLEEPFYVGIGFCSHLPDQVDTAILSRVVLENEAGKVQ